MDRLCCAQQGARRPLNDPAGTAADHCFSIRGWSPCKSEAGREVVFLRRTQAFWDSRLFCSEDGSIANRSLEIWIQNLKVLSVRYRCSSGDSVATGARA